MSGKYAWIIFLLLGLWHLIGTFAEKAAKKQQQQRLKAQGSQELRPSARRHPGGATSTTLVDHASELATCICIGSSSIRLTRCPPYYGMR